MGLDRIGQLDAEPGTGLQDIGKLEGQIINDRCVWYKEYPLLDPLRPYHALQ